MVVALAGCAENAVVLGPSGPRHAGRTEQQRHELIKPGNFGNNAAADRLRGRFDFWNEEVVGSDVAVGTVFMGDSITELWEINAYFAPTNGIIVNRGIGGDIATDMNRRFDADVIQLKPRNVVILAGTNDVARLLAANKSDEEMIATVTTAIGAMMDRAKAAGINVLVCSILPTNADTGPHQGKARVLPQINARLKAMCEGKGCVYVDYAAGLVDQNGALRKDLSRDGLHPIYSGYDIMARCLLETARQRGIRL